jgi:hypothetical protein
VAVATAEAVAAAIVVAAAEAVVKPTRRSFYGVAVFSVLKILHISVSLQPLLKTRRR